MSILRDIHSAIAKVKVDPAVDGCESLLDHSNLELEKSLQELEQRFNGRNLWAALLGTLRSGVAGIAMTGLVLVAIAAFLPIALRFLFSALDVGEKRSALQWAAAITLLMGMQVCFAVWRMWMERRVMIQIQQLMNRFLLRRLRDVDMNALRQEKKEPLAFVTSYAGQLTQSIYTVDFAIGIVMIAVLVTIMFTWYGVISLGALAAVVVMTFILQHLIGVIGNVYHTYLQADHRRVSLVKLILENIRSIRCQQLTAQVHVALDDVRKDQQNILQHRARWQILNRTLEDHFPTLTSLVLVGSVLFTKTAVYAAELFPLMVLLGVIVDTVSNNLANYRVLRNTMGPTREVEALCRQAQPLDQSTTHVPGHMRIWPMAELNRRLDIPAGSRIAVLGKTGSGKTRLLSQLAGEIRSMDSGGLTGEAFGNTIMVTRDQPLLDGLFGDIVTLWSPAIDEVRYQQALYASGWLNELAADQEGDARPLNGHQRNISEGQQQRLAIAQALYQEPDVLLLDDVFASMNPELADTVIQRVLQSRPGQSVLYTTSRVELAFHAEQLLLLDGDRYALLEVSRLHETNAVKQLHEILGQDFGQQVLNVLQTRTCTTTTTSKNEELKLTLLRHARKLTFAPTQRAPSLLAYDQSARQHITLRGLWHNTLGIFRPATVALLFIALLAITATNIWSTSLIAHIKDLLTISTGNTFILFLSTAILGISASILRYGLSFLSPIQTIDRLHHRMVTHLTSGQANEKHGTRLAGRLTQDFQALEMEIPNNVVSLAAAVTSALGTIGYLVAGAPIALVLLLPCALLLSHVYYANQNVVVNAAHMRASTRAPMLSLLGSALATVSFRRSHMVRNALECRFSFLADIQAAGSYWAALASVRVAFMIQGLGWLIFVAVLWSVLVSQSSHSVIATPSLLIFLALTFSRQLVGLVNHIQGGDILQTQFERLAEVLDQPILPRADERTEVKARPLQLIPPPLSTSPALKTRNLCFDTERGERVFDGFSLQIETGECVALVGPSGSGKSTLAQLFIGHLTPQEGQVLQFGIPSTRIADWKVSTVMLESRIPALEISVHRFLDPHGKINPEHLCKLLSNLGLSTFLEARFTDLSLGQQQIVNIARIIITVPHILILDEATSGLDTLDERRVFEVLQKQTFSITVLAILHRPDNLTLMNRIIEINSKMYISGGGI